MKKILTLILFITIQTILCSISAQFTTKEALFFCKAGEGVVENHGVQIIIIYSNGTIGHTNRTPYVIKKNINESENYYENLIITDIKNGWIYKYCPSKSTNSRVVYMREAYINVYPEWNGCPLYGATPTRKLDRYEYIAITQDKSSYISWTEKPNNYDGKVLYKTYYSRVPKSEFLPKSVNYDFLNE